MKRYNSQLKENIDYKVVSNFFKLVSDKRNVNDIAEYIVKDNSIDELTKIAIVKNLRNIANIILGS